MNDKELKDVCVGICNEVKRKNISDDAKEKMATEMIKEKVEKPVAITFHSAAGMSQFMGMIYGETETILF